MNGQIFLFQEFYAVRSNRIKKSSHFWSLRIIFMYYFVVTRL